MRTPALLLTVVALCVSLGLAQDEVIPPKHSRMAKVGLFGGFTPGMLFPNVKPINDFLVAGGAAPLKERLHQQHIPRRCDEHPARSAAQDRVRRGDRRICRAYF